MDQTRPRPNPSPDAVGDARHRADSRRCMLRRSLSLASPVVLTLASAPVSAGLCMSASAFVSTNPLMSRQPRGAQACQGKDPTYWATNASYWPFGVKPSDKFHVLLGTQVMDPRQFTTAAQASNNMLSLVDQLLSKGQAKDDGQPTLLEVLAQPKTVEAHVAAVWLNAQRYTMVYPFNDIGAIKQIWANIAAHRGYYSPGDNLPALTAAGTLQWLAQTWDGKEA
jgi:hypothetical protein